MHRIVRGGGRAAAVLLAIAAAPLAASADDLSPLEAQALTNALTDRGAQISSAQLLGEVETGAIRNGTPHIASRRIPAGRCLAVFATGSGMTNLDLTLLRGRAIVPSGPGASQAAAIVRDQTTGRDAEARVCAEAREATITIRLTHDARGSGSFALAAFVFDPSVANAEAPPAVLPGSLGALAAVAAAQSTDTDVVTPPALETLRAGQRIEREISLLGGRCYRLVTSVDAAARDLTVAVVDARGADVQRSAPSSAPTLGITRPLCVGATAPHRVAFSVSGAGGFAWQMLAVRTAQPATRPVSASAAPSPIGGTADDFVARSIRARHRSAHAGSVVAPIHLATIATAATSEVRVPLMGGVCYVVLAASVPSMRELELVVYDGVGNEVARGEARSMTPSARACVQVSSSHRVVLRALGGYGAAGVQVFELPSEE